jgi:hypothetical protein
VRAGSELCGRALALLGVTACPPATASPGAVRPLTGVMAAQQQVDLVSPPRDGAPGRGRMAVRSRRRADPDHGRLGPAAPATAWAVRPAICGAMAGDRVGALRPAAPGPGGVVTSAELPGHTPQCPPLAWLPVLSSTQAATHLPGLNAVHRRLQLGPRRVGTCRIASMVAPDTGRSWAARDVTPVGAQGPRWMRQRLHIRHAWGLPVVGAPHRPTWLRRGWSGGQGSRPARWIPSQL